MAVDGTHKSCVVVSFYARKRHLDSRQLEELDLNHFISVSIHLNQIMRKASNNSYVELLNSCVWLVPNLWYVHVTFLELFALGGRGLGGFY